MKERVETNSMDKKLKWLRYLSVALVITTTIKILMKSDKSFTGLGQLVDGIIMITLGGYFTYKSYKKDTKARLGQFIEWEEDKFNFRLKGDKEIITILKSEVDYVSISLDNIKITKFDKSVLNLDISDFTEYGKRLKIKSNFSDITKN